MPDIVRTRTIAAALEDVWPVLADFAAISSWADNVDHSCILEHGASGDVIGVGTARRIQTGRTTLVERIVTFDPPSTLVYGIEGLPARIRSVKNRWDLEPGEPGATVVSLTSMVDIGPRPPQQLAARALGQVLARQSDVMLAGLANRLENHRG